MEFYFEGVVKLTLEHTPGDNGSKHVSTDFYLEVSDNIIRDMYLTKDDLPTREGSRVLTSTLVQGLVANIHMAHQQGFRDSAEHLRYIIAELERGFIQVAEAKKAKY
jgi:hypothetical protein